MIIIHTSLKKEKTYKNVQLIRYCKCDLIRLYQRVIKVSWRYKVIGGEVPECYVKVMMR